MPVHNTSKLIFNLFITKLFLEIFCFTNIKKKKRLNQEYIVLIITQNCI
jgi:hypothetical protein